MQNLCEDEHFKVNDKENQKIYRQISRYKKLDQKQKWIFVKKINLRRMKRRNRKHDVNSFKQVT